MQNTSKIKKSAFRSPQLKRVVLLSINALHSPCKAPGGLVSHFKNRISLELLAPSDSETNPRIRLGVEVAGKWSVDKDSEPVITFDGAYEGRFEFPEPASTKEVNSWLEDGFYRESLIAQVIPVVNTHVFAQLEMMGLRTNKRPLGFSPQSITPVQAAKKAQARPRAKKASSGQLVQS